jgi:hypothetical protein
MTRTIITIAFAGLLLAQASDEIRIDQFDKKGNRTGYMIIDQRTGRYDSYDKNSNRTGFGSVTSPRSRESGTSSDSQSGRSIYGTKWGR